MKMINPSVAFEGAGRWEVVVVGQTPELPDLPVETLFLPNLLEDPKQVLEAEATVLAECLIDNEVVP